MTKDLGAHEKGLVEIAVEPVVVERDVNVDDVAVLQRAQIRDAVANDLVDRSVDTARHVSKAGALGETKRTASICRGRQQHTYVHTERGKLW